MIILTLFQFLLMFHEFLFLIVLGLWLFLYRNDFVKSPNPLFAYAISMINSALFLIIMIYNGFSFTYFFIYLICVIYKIFSILDLIFGYKATIDYISIFITIIIIFIITIISSVITNIYSEN
jgi:hypothetical protein